MPIPSSTLQTYQKTRVDLAIETFADIENPTVSDLNNVIVQADIHDKVERYRLGALKMNEKQLEGEKHRSSKLARYMTHAGDPRPSSYCDCHAMVSGKHKDAAPIRAIMAWCLMRIDDPRNGCWLPRHYDVRNHMPKWLKSAVPHQGLHNERYYEWLGTKINPESVDGLGSLIDVLKMVRHFLQSGALPPEAWPKR